VPKTDKTSTLGKTQQNSPKVAVAADLGGNRHTKDDLLNWWFEQSGGLAGRGRRYRIPGRWDWSLVVARQLFLAAVQSECPKQYQELVDCRARAFSGSDFPLRDSIAAWALRWNLIESPGKPAEWVVSACIVAMTTMVNTHTFGPGPLPDFVHVPQSLYGPGPFPEQLDIPNLLTSGLSIENWETEILNRAKSELSRIGIIPVPKRRAEDFRWAARYQVGGMSVLDLVEEDGYQETVVSDTIREVLSFIGISRRNKPGRPRRRSG
jgi:hypothetical protein